jgi:hypothetical protein
MQTCIGCTLRTVLQFQCPELRQSPCQRCYIPIAILTQRLGQAQGGELTAARFRPVVTHMSLIWRHMCEAVPGQKQSPLNILAAKCCSPEG